MYTISVVYRKPGDPQKYITFCQMPGDNFNEYFTKQVCMNYEVEYVSSQLEEDQSRRIYKAEKERLGVIRKPYEFFAGKMKRCLEILGLEVEMKLVIDRIGTPGDYSRTIVNLDKLAMLELCGSGEDEALLVQLYDGSLKSYETNDHQFGLPDGHGGIVCASPQEVMNAYLELDMKGTDER